jgi:putative colanic acid biosynthesis UDP-glucose lipid carrier transferase
MEDFHSQLNHPLIKLIKRLIDVLVSWVMILFLFPWLIPLIALFIRLDSKGPVFFFQVRHKRGGKKFTCIKFRTMQVNADADSSPATDKDYRITHVGKILRKYHWDELPQLFNVWWGDMSLVGPRPFMTSDHNSFRKRIPGYDYRHHVKPGITGLAQALGFAGPMTDSQTLKDRISLDHYYICNWSASLEFRILLLTLKKVTGIRFRKKINQII